jgi:arsenate reductase-like glutaredoxin family protein
MGLAERTLSRSEALELMMKDANLIKRPLVLPKKGKAVFGYKPEEYDKL